MVKTRKRSYTMAAMTEKEVPISVDKSAAAKQPKPRGKQTSRTEDVSEPMRTQVTGSSVSKVNNNINGHVKAIQLSKTSVPNTLKLPLTISCAALEHSV
jgi:hypothetical protein